MKSFKASLIALAILMSLNTENVKAQDLEKTQSPISTLTKNTFFVEGGGNSVVASLNYSRTMFQQDKTKLTARIGAGTSVWTHVNIPIELTLLYGNNHHFEFGPGYRLGMVFGADDPDDEIVEPNIYTASSFTLRAGYRYQAGVESERHLFVSTGVVLSVTPDNYEGEYSQKRTWVFPVPSLAVGYSF